MQSLYDSSVKISEDSGAVTIVYHKAHAALVIENCRTDTGQREVRWAHFIPKTGTDATKFCYANFTAEITAEEREGRVEHKMIHASSSFDVNKAFNKHKITYVSSTYSATTEQINSLVKSVYADSGGSNVLKKFHIRGTGDTWNCRGWVREKMSIVDVHLPKTWIDETSSDTLGSDGLISSYGTSTSDKSCLLL